jgi:hypothetical protein
VGFAGGKVDGASSTQLAALKASLSLTQLSSSDFASALPSLASSYDNSFFYFKYTLANTSTTTSRISGFGFYSTPQITARRWATASTSLLSTTLISRCTRRSTSV